MCYAACELSKTLLKFLFVVGRFGSGNLRFDLCDALIDSLFVACAIDDGGVVFVDGNALGSTQHVDGCTLQFDTLLFADNGATGEDSDVFEHLFTTVAEARCFNSADFELRTQTVDNQRGECFAIYILGDDEQGTTALYGGLQDGEQLFEVADFLVVDKDVWFVHLYLHGLGVGNEVGADIAAIELHTLYHVNGGVHALCLTDGDNTIFAYFAHGVSNKFAYLCVVVSRDSGYLLDFVEVVTYYLALLFDACHNGSNGFVHTALQVHGVSAGGNILDAYANDGLCEDSGSGGAITCLVAGLGGNLLDELCAEVLGCVCQLNLFCYGNTVFSDVGSTILLVDNYIASFGTQCYFYCVSQLVNATLQRVSRLGIVCDFFCHSCLFYLFSYLF